MPASRRVRRRTSERPSARLPSAVADKPVVPAILARQRRRKRERIFTEHFPRHGRLDSTGERNVARAPHAVLTMPFVNADPHVIAVQLGVPGVVPEADRPFRELFPCHRNTRPARSARAARHQGYGCVPGWLTRLPKTCPDLLRSG